MIDTVPVCNKCHEPGTDEKPLREQPDGTLLCSRCEAYERFVAEDR
jgi:formylmethanofuran dehydrogenase subunit E